MPLHSFYTHANFGDVMEQLNFLRRLSVEYPGHEFVQFTKTAQVEQLREFVADTPAIRVEDIKDQTPNALCSWIGHEGFVWRFPNRNRDRVSFLVAWFKRLASLAGLESPIHRVEDLLFDFPALLKPVPVTADILVINSSPLSGQCRSYQVGCLDSLAQALAQKHTVISTEKIENIHCTRDHGLSLCGIGSLSRSCKAVVGIATGPVWPTINVWNHGKVDIVYIVDNEHINYGDQYFKTSNEFEARQIMGQRGYL